MLSFDTVEMTYSHRCWKVQWADVKRAFQVFQNDHNTETDHNKFRYDATVFFILVAHVPEWVEYDDDPGCQLITKLGDVESKNADFTLARNFANTAKHHTRSGTGPTVFVSSVRVNPGTHRTEGDVVELRADGTQSIRDSLQLATDLVSSWEALLAPSLKKGV